MGAAFFWQTRIKALLAAGISQGIAAVVELRQHLALLGTALHRIQTIRGLQEKIKDIDRLVLDLARRQEEAPGGSVETDRGQRARFLTDDYTRFKQNRDRIAVLHAKGKDIRAALNGCSRSTGRQAVNMPGPASRCRKMSLPRAGRMRLSRLCEPLISGSMKRRKKPSHRSGIHCNRWRKNVTSACKSVRSWRRGLPRRAARLERFELFFPGTCER